MRNTAKELARAGNNSTSSTAKRPQLSVRKSHARRNVFALAHLLIGVGIVSAIPSIAQNTSTMQAPGAPQGTTPVVISEGQGVATATGRQTQVFSTVLFPDPNDPEHATDPRTGRNFHWDSATNTWVNSQTGESFHAAGYLCSTPGSSPQQPTAPPLQTPPTTGTTRPAAPSSSQTSMGTTGAGIQFQLRGFGGATIVNGNAPATAGFDGAVLFPLGNHVLVGPTAGFQWVNSSIVSSIGSMTPGSTFANTSVGFKQGNFGGRIGFPFGGWQLGIQGGATVAGSTITQIEGFCGPTGCTTSSSTTTHDTVVGPFVGGYIGHSIFSHVGVFVEYDYVRLKDTKPNPTNPSGPAISVFDLHYSNVVAGIVLTFGRH